MEVQMGLDMWLSKRRKLPSASEAVAVQYEVEEIAQWRKANAIHCFFDARVANGVDNCVEYVVATSDVRDLLERVTEVLEHPEGAARQLPTMAGFFFGSLDYDERYRDELERTHQLLADALAKAKPDDEFVYSAWW
jgi:hypothetical protein